MVTSFLTQPEIVMVRPAVAALAALMATGVVFKLVPKSGGGSAYKVPQRFPGQSRRRCGWSDLRQGGGSLWCDWYCQRWRL
jgi:hypothetical protein